MSSLLRLSLLFAFSLSPWIARAAIDVTNAQGSSATSNGTDVNEEERMKVKKRLYPGGRDEEPLQVQSQLVTPTRAAVSPDELPDNDAD